MEERLKEIVDRIPFDLKTREEFAAFIDDICEDIGKYGMRKRNKEIFVKFSNCLLPLLRQEGNIVKLDNVSKLKVCGDIHGDLPSLLSFLEGCNLEEDYIIFLGDYIDKGDYSVQVLLVVFLLKVAMPNRVVLLRGNHERYGSAEMAQIYSFCFVTLAVSRPKAKPFFNQCYNS